MEQPGESLKLDEVDKPHEGAVIPKLRGRDIMLDSRLPFKVLEPQDYMAWNQSSEIGLP